MEPKWEKLHEVARHMLQTLVWQRHPCCAEEQMLEKWYEDWKDALVAAAIECQEESQRATGSK